MMRYAHQSAPLSGRDIHYSACTAYDSAYIYAYLLDVVAAVAAVVGASAVSWCCIGTTVVSVYGLIVVHSRVGKHYRFSHTHAYSNSASSHTNDLWQLAYASNRMRERLATCVANTGLIADDVKLNTVNCSNMIELQREHVAAIAVGLSIE
eukprot:11611-Heterococcus_DN1.PRE.3